MDLAEIGFKLGHLNMAVEVVKQEVMNMKKSVRTWALLGGFLASVTTALGIHLTACGGTVPTIPPSVQVGADQAVCVLDNYGLAAKECNNMPACVAEKLLSIASQCGVTQDIVNLIIDAHKSAEYKEANMAEAPRRLPWYPFGRTVH